MITKSNSLVENGKNYCLSGSFLYSNENFADLEYKRVIYSKALSYTTLSSCLLSNKSYTNFELHGFFSGPKKQGLTVVNYWTNFEFPTIVVCSRSCQSTTRGGRSFGRLNPNRRRQQTKRIASVTCALPHSSLL